MGTNIIKIIIAIKRFPDTKFLAFTHVKCKLQSEKVYGEVNGVADQCFSVVSTHNFLNNAGMHEN